MQGGVGGRLASTVRSMNEKHPAVLSRLEVDADQRPSSNPATPDSLVRDAGGPHVREGFRTHLLAAFFLVAALTPGPATAERLRGSVPRGGVIYVIDRLATPKLPKDVLAAMRPLNTLEEIQALLNARAIAFRRENIEINTGHADQRLVELLEQLPPGGVFVGRSDDGGYTIGRIAHQRVTMPVYDN